MTSEENLASKLTITSQQLQVWLIFNKNFRIISSLTYICIDTCNTKVNVINNSKHAWLVKVKNVYKYADLAYTGWTSWDNDHMKLKIQVTIAVLHLKLDC